jgi:hypothetical protein
VYDEIYGDGHDLEGSLHEAVHAAGWLDGPAETPHRLTLRPRARRSIASFEIDQDPEPIVDALHQRAGAIGYRRHDCLAEWRDGAQTIWLASAQNGELHGRDYLHEYPAYEGNNPRTGERVGKRVPYFVFADPFANVPAGDP